MYSLNELMRFSLIYSKLVYKNSFYTPLFNHRLLYLIFHESIKQNINIFELEKDDFFNFLLYIDEINFKQMKEIINFFSINNRTLHAIIDSAESEIELCKNHNIEMLEFTSDNYPSELKELKDPPFILFYKGNFFYKNNFPLSLCIIGKRDVSPKGAKKAEETGVLLNKSNIFNISGLAYGCDTYGHISTIGQTGAILGQGLATPIYPPENQSLADEIIKNNGFLASEIPPSHGTKSLYFIKRNRLQAALSEGLIVVECNKNSGTVHTIKSALNLKKLVYVFDFNKEIINMKNIIKIKNLDSLEARLKDLFLKQTKLFEVKD